MSDSLLSGGGAPASSEDRNLAFVGYALLFVAPFVFGVTALIAVVIAYVRKPEAEPALRSHYGYQIHVFWIAFCLGLIAALGALFGLGFLISDLIEVVARHSRYDAWDWAAMEGEDVRVRAVTFIGFGTAVLASVLGGLWLLVASLFGVARLAAYKPVGRIS